MHITPAYTSRLVMHPGQQVMVGLDVSVPTVIDVGPMTFDTQPAEMVIY